MVLEKGLEALTNSINRGSYPGQKDEKMIIRETKFSSRQALQAKKLFKKLSSLLHLHLKSTKNKTLLDQT
jgi:hypothetical protein